MLEFISIKNFRSCDDLVLNLNEPVVALLGKNGAGKTNVLHAVQLVADLCVGDPDPIFSLSPRDTSKPSEFGLGFTVGSSKFVYQTSRVSGHGKDEVLSEVLTKDGSDLFRRKGEIVNTGMSATRRILLGMRASTLPALLQLLPDESDLTAELNPIANYLKCIQYHPLLQGFQEHLPRPSARGAFSDPNSNYSPLIELSRYEAWKAQFAEGRATRSVQMRLLHLALANETGFEELKTLLGEKGLGIIADIRIDEVEIRSRTHAATSDDVANSKELGYSIGFMPGSGLAGSGQYFRYSGLSAGTWRILQLLTYLIFDNNACMLVEQPEDSIHQGLLTKVVDTLRSYSGRTQLICTTHSPRVINLIGPKGIRFIRAVDGTTQVFELSEQEITAARKYLEDEGTLAEFLELL